MKKGFVLHVLLVVYCLFSFGQKKQIKDFDYFVGQPYQAVVADHNYFFNQEDEVLSIKMSGQMLIIQKYEGYELLQKSYLSYKKIPKQAVVLDAFVQSGHYYLLYQFSEYDKTKIVAIEIEFSTGTFLKEQQLVEIKGQYQGELFFSYGKNKVLIVCEDVNSDDILCVVLENELKITDDFHLKDENILTYGVNSDGSVFYVTAKFNTEISDTKRNREEPKNYKTVCHVVASDEEKEVSLSALTGNTNSALLVEKKTGEMICAGFAQQGIFSYLITKRGEIIEYEVQGLPWTNNLILKELIITDQNDLLVTGEQYHFYRDELVDSDGEVFTSYRNHYGSILVAKFSSVDKEKWVKTIPKIQESKKVVANENEQGSMSYRFVEVGGRYSFIFLDSRLNKDLPIGKSKAIYDVSKPAVLTMVSLAPKSGEMKKNIILDTKYIASKQAFSFASNKVISISPNEFLLEMYRKKAGDFLIRVKCLAD